MNPVSFFVAGEPKSLQIKGVASFKKGGRDHHVPKRGNTEWGGIFAAEVRRVWESLGNPTWAEDDAILLTVTFWVPRPVSLTKKPRKDGKPRRPVKRPDVDNLFNKLTDLVSRTFWPDDSQIVRVVMEKDFHPSGLVGVEVRIEDRDPTPVMEGVPASTPATLPLFHETVSPS